MPRSCWTPSPACASPRRGPRCGPGVAHPRRRIVMEPGDPEAMDVQLEQELGPVTLAQLAQLLGWPLDRTEAALAELQQRGRVREERLPASKDGELNYLHASRPPR